MSKINLPDNIAQSRGYTQFAIAECEGEELHVLLREDADLSGVVTAWDTAGKAWVELNGMFWQFDIGDTWID